MRFSLLLVLLFCLLLHAASAFRRSVAKVPVLGARALMPRTAAPAVGLFRTNQRMPIMCISRSEGDEDAPDYEAIVAKIASDKRAQMENAELEEQERKRQVLQRRRDKEYNAYWEREENKGKGSKDLATLRSYYAGKNGTMAATVAGGEDERWDFQDVPVSPRAGAVSTLGLGLALLVGLVAAKKLRGGEEKPVARKKRIKNAINMPGVGVISVE